jgi:hypothetical protein
MQRQATRRNPNRELAGAMQLSQSWHGRAPRSMREVAELLEVRTDFADMAGLEELVVISRDGGEQITMRFGHDVRLCGGLDRPCTEEDAKAIQLYFVGGDQEICLADFGIDTPHDKELLGTVQSIAYVTTKKHLNARNGPFEHEFGEEGGELPTLVYDNLNKKLELIGGSYAIALGDYDGRHSAGIRN